MRYNLPGRRPSTNFNVLMPSALDLLAAAISEQQVDDCHVVVSTEFGSVESLLRRDALFEDEDEDQFDPEDDVEDVTPAPAPQEPAQPQEQAPPRVLFGIFSVSPFLAHSICILLTLMLSSYLHRALL